MKEIRLVTKERVLVDDEDFEYLSQFKWYCLGHGQYALRYFSPRKYLLMHREILNVPKGMFVDHINHNTLDNRRINLRICTPMESTWNVRKDKRKLSSKFKGVSLHSQNLNWRAVITYNHKYISIGSFRTERQAAMAYDLWAKDLFGEFASLNFSQLH